MTRIVALAAAGLLAAAVAAPAWAECSVGHTAAISKPAPDVTPKPKVGS